MKKEVSKFVVAVVTSLLLFVPVGGTFKSSVPRLGTYTMSITAADTLPNVPAEVRSNFDGRWEMTLAKGNMYHISKDGTVAVEGRLNSIPATIAPAGEKIGLPQCDDFIAKYDACVSSKVPETARAQFKSDIEQWRASWKKLADNPATKKSLAAACKQAATQQEAALKSYGCTWSANEQLTLTDEKGVLACTQQPGIETGTYKWNYQQQELTFTAVEDKCGGRRAVLTLHPWRKVR